MNFVPPKPNSVVIRLTRSVLPLVLRSRSVTEVQCREQDLARLRALRGERVALLPNHPTTTDPAVMYHVGKLVDQRFYFLCCIEAFRDLRGAWGWLIQRCGAYSITRGTPDRKAFKMTRELLAQPGAKLVAFPEGEVYSQNDSLLPFHSGLTQLLFWAQEDVLRRSPGETIQALPVTIKYRFAEDMGPAILTCFIRLEAALGLPDGGGDGPYARLRRVGEKVVGKLETQYGVRDQEGAELGPRMAALKQAIVERIAGGLQVRPPEGPLPDTVRYLTNTLHRVTDEEPREPCPYDLRLWEDERQRLRPLVRDLDRLSNWIAVYDGYVAERPTPERIAETVRRLEIEVLGKPYCIGKQHCLVRMGEPVAISDHYQPYVADKSQTVDTLTRQFEQNVRAMLDEMG